MTLLAAVFWLSLTAYADPSPIGCKPVSHAGQDYTVCTLDMRVAAPRLHLRAPDGKIYGNFDRLEATLAEDGRTLLFAMNGGMYHRDRKPVGLYISGDETLARLNTNDGPGNFHLKPNGVFFVADGSAGVMTSDAFKAAAPDVSLATQSGPMLVINGQLHPRFRQQSDSLRTRNGVGVSDDGMTVLFAISERPVNFYTFGTLFRDTLGVDNALFLDGRISRLYARDLGRNDYGAPMGPILAVSIPREAALPDGDDSTE